MIRVGVLMHGADRPLTGVTRVAVELGRALERRSDCEVVFLTPYRRGPFRGEPATWSAYMPGCRRVPGLMILGPLEISIIARRLHLDVVHDPVGVSPFILGRWAGDFRRVLSIHDAIAFQLPEAYPLLNNLLHRWYVPRTLPNVDAVITHSAHAKGDLEQFLHLSPDRIHVVSPGVSEVFRQAPDESPAEVAARHGLRQPYVLNVGVKQARKNLPGLLAAFAQLNARLPGYQLALVGPTLWRHGDLRETIGTLGLNGAVRVLGFVPDEDLRALYSQANVFVFPSLYEGFGLPVLEAMSCGVPVVCSNTTSLPEVGGDVAVLVDPRDPAAIARAMEEVLTDPELASSLRARGRERAREFTWDRYADSTMRVYEEVVSTGRGAHRGSSAP